MSATRLLVALGACLILLPPAICAKTVQATQVATGEELQNAVIEGTLHNLVTEQVDMRTLAPVQRCGTSAFEYLLCVDANIFDANDTAIIRGDCARNFTGQATDASLPPLFPSQCLVLVNRPWLYVGFGPSLWLHNLHVSLSNRTAGYQKTQDMHLMMLVASSRVWASQVGLQGDDGVGQLLIVNTAVGHNLTKAIFTDSYFGDIRYPYAGVAALVMRSQVSLQNVTVSRAVSSSSARHKGAITAHGSTGVVLCSSCNFDEASAPGLSIEGNGSLYDSAASPVWNADGPGSFGTALPAFSVPAGVQFLRMNDTDLVAVKQDIIDAPLTNNDTLNGTALWPAPAPWPPAESIPLANATSNATSKPPLPPPPQPIYVRLTSDGTMHVSSGSDLQKAIDAGASVIRIVQHLDMRSLKEQCGALVCADPSHLPATRLSLQGSCSTSSTPLLVAPVEEALTAMQCLVVVDTTWLMVDASVVWVHNIQVVVQSASDIGIESLVHLKSGARLYASLLWLQGNGVGTERLVSVNDEGSKLLLQDGYLADGGGGNSGGSSAPGLQTYGFVTLIRTLFERLPPKSNGTVISVNTGGIMCANCSFDSVSRPPIGLRRVSSQVYSDVTVVIILLVTGKRVNPQPISEAPPGYFLRTSDKDYQDFLKAAGLLRPEESNASRVGMVVGITIGLLAVVCASVAIGFFIRRSKHAHRHKPHKPTPREPTPAMYDVFLTHEWLGRDGNNHSRVQRVHQSLLRLDIQPWFDEEEMQGDIQARMAEGIQKSAGALVFMTQRYHDKVLGSNAQDNCKFEFDILMNSKLGNVVTVVMEDSMLDTRSWSGKVSALAMRLFVPLLNIDKLSDEQLDVYLQEELVPQMTWLTK